MNHPCLCLIAPISQHIMLPQSTVATALIFNWVVPSPGVSSVAESLIRDLSRVSEWCDLWGMKLNASKKKTMIVSRSRTMHPQSTPLTNGRTVLKVSDDLVILGVTFDSKKTFEKHLRSVSRAASQRLGILRKCWRVFHDRSITSWEMLSGFCPAIFRLYCFAVWCSAANIHLKLLDRAVGGARFLTGGMFECDIVSSIRGSLLYAL